MVTPVQLAIVRQANLQWPAIRSSRRAGFTRRFAECASRKCIGLGKCYQHTPSPRNPTGVELSDAVARISYEQAGVQFTREVFVTAPGEAIVIRLTANKPGAITFDAVLDRPERFSTVADSNNGLLMRGQLNNGTDGNGMKYAARLRVLARGAATNVDGAVVRVTKVNEALIFIAAATNFQGFAGRQTPNELTAAANDLRKATSKPFAALYFQ